MSSRALQRVPMQGDTRIKNDEVQYYTGMHWVVIKPPTSNTGAVKTTITTSAGGMVDPYTGDIITVDLKVKCDACEQQVSINDIGDTYGHEPYRLRSICMKCYMKARDKMYGVKSNVDLEDTLYGKK